MSRMSTDALRALKGVASRWPSDTVRPKLQMSAAIEQAAEKCFGADSAIARSAAPQSQSGASTSVSPEAVPARQLTKPEAAWADKMEGSLQRLMDDRALATYPASQRIMQPASYPDHYEKLQQGLDRFRRGDKPRLSWFEWLQGKK